VEAAHRTFTTTAATTAETKSYSGGRLMAADPSGGYWTVSWLGAIASFGGAPTFGSPSLSGLHLAKPIVGMAATPDGQGYRLVASDGGVFTYGDATFYGSTGAIHLNEPIAGMAPTPDGHGYWLVAGDGGIFTFGDAPFSGSLGGGGKTALGMIISPPATGYTLVEMGGAAVVPTLTPSGSSSTTIPPAAAGVSTADSAEPSGESPPGADALAGYTQSYVNDFTGTTLPAGWDPYGGQPGSDPGAQWSPAHDVVSNGMLQLETYQDPAYGNEWVAGGLCQCGHAQTYGAYYVRSRVTGAGPTQVQLLWPAGPGWPPEVDFNESDGSTTITGSTLHFGADNGQDHRQVSIDLTQWHTWGVIWTPTSVTYTVDGQVWGTITVASEIPDEPMTLDLQQQTWCGSGYACPTTPVSMDIDWVAEYSPG
jgi:hypothetical protein